MKTKKPKEKIADRLTGETQLLLDDHILSEIDGDNEIISSGAYIKINGVLIDALKPVRIDAEALIDLYDRSDSLRTNPIDILALKITFGVDSTNELHFLYQPICLELKESLCDAKLQKQGIFTITDKGDMHKYEYPLLVFTPTDLGTSSTYYQEKLLMVHRKDDGFEPFNNDDTTSVIFSFQEIFALLDDNESEYLKIYNSIRRTKDPLGFFSRHSLILASKNTGPLFPFENKYANLAHLCPPNCNRFIYPLKG